MPWISGNIETYRVNLGPLRRWSFGNGAEDVDFDCYIVCKMDNGQTLYMYFARGEDVPGSFVRANGNWYAFVCKDQYVYYLDILRNEKPVYGHVYEQDGWFELSTSQEPTGEGPGEP
jgi:hypothetical protein